MTPSALPTATEPAPRGLGDYLTALRRRWYLVVICPVLAVAVALGVAHLQPKVYVARSEMLAATASSASGGQQGAQVNAASLATQLQLMRSATVRRQVADKLQIRPDQVPGVSPAPIGQTLVVSVAVSSTDPELAARAADAYVEVFIENRRNAAVDSLAQASSELQTRVDALQKRIDEIDAEVAAAPPAQRAAVQQSTQNERNSAVSQQVQYRQRIDQTQVDSSLQDGGGQLVTPASVPGKPVSPTPTRDAAVALVAGLVVGVALALLVDTLDDSIRDDEDIRRVTADIPVLATVPIARPDKRGPISVEKPSSPAAEAYRTLRTSVMFLGIDRPLRVLQITSAVPGEGKSTTAANLAVVMARAGQRVCLVDCDLRRASQHVLFGVAPEPGLTSVIVGAATLQDCLRQVPGEDRFYILPAGPPPPNPSELLSSPTLGQIFETLTAPNNFDVVIVDAPPVLPFTDAALLSTRVDGTILVAGVGQSRRKRLTRVLHTLGLVSAPIVGIVLNKARGDGAAGAYRYSSRYNSYTKGSGNGDAADPEAVGAGRGRKRRARYAATD